MPRNKPTMLGVRQSCKAEKPESMAAIHHLEQAVLAADWTVGIALRYGSLYGHGTSMAPGAGASETIRNRKFPLVASAAGVLSFVQQQV
jgi:hypothetical protein